MRNHTFRAGLVAAMFAAWAYGAPVLAQPVPVSGTSTAGLADLATAYQNGVDEPAVGATGDSAKVRTLAYSEFVALVEKGGVRSVRIEGATLTGKLGNGSTFRTVAPADPALIDRLLSHQVRIEAAANNSAGFLDSPLFQSLLIGVLMVGAILFTSRQGTQSGGSNKAASFGRSRARLISPDAHRTTFADVAGIEEAAGELDEIVRYLREPSAFLRLGGRVPKGVLLVGPPGTGKTLLARAVAGEAGVPFFSISGAEFVEMFVGVGAARVRDLFREARQHAPCIVFIDEIDAVGRHRSSGAGGNDEREQTVNQLLVEMDGFSASESVIVLAATNRPDVLDTALLRPGRFDRQVMVPAPDTAGRQKILEVHMRPVPVAADVDSAVIARGTPGFAGADLANLVNEAALIAVRRGHARVSMADFDEARDKVLLGPERRSLAVTAREREMTAYHEAGHALVALRSPYQDPLHKVTIVPRGRAFGVTLSLPERDRHSFSKRQLEGRLAMMFGGRVAEELVYGREEVTTGASDDIRQATQLARRMVTEFGFSDTVGVVCCESGVDPHGMPVAMSAAMASTIDSEVRRITGEAEAEARRILVTERAVLERIAQALLARETLTGEEIDALLDGSRDPQLGVAQSEEAEHAELEHAAAA